MAEQKDPRTLVDEKMAISLFLDALLQEPVITETADAPAVDDQPAVEEVMAIPAPVTEVETGGGQADAQYRQQAEQREAFQVLIFIVNGLKLAVPLVELSGVIEWDEAKLTEMPGHAGFYLGLLRHLDYHIPVIDTASMVFPANKMHELQSRDARENTRHIILINDYQWGLACDEIGDVLTLQHDEVRWRRDDTRRPWLAGTVVKQMCALLNSRSFAEMLRGDTNKK